MYPSEERRLLLYFLGEYDERLMVLDFGDENPLSSLLPGNMRGLLCYEGNGTEIVSGYSRKFGRALRVHTPRMISPFSRLDHVSYNPDGDFFEFPLVPGKELDEDRTRVHQLVILPGNVYRDKDGNPKTIPMIRGFLEKLAQLRV